MTGGVGTHDAIVWGSGSEAAARRAAATPLLKVPISSELGSVTPFIVTPGPGTRKQLELQANPVAMAMGG
jgi:aldehyde dehydrogenase (NAD(P)+)